MSFFVWTVGDVISGLAVLAFVLLCGWAWVMEKWDEWRRR